MTALSYVCKLEQITQQLHQNNSKGLAELELTFTHKELESYTKARMIELIKKSKEWIRKASDILWNVTHGTISKKQMEILLKLVSNKHKSEDSIGKVINFAKAFLKYLTKTRLDTSYQAFAVFLDRPKTFKERKNVTSRIITKDDIKNVFTYIKKSEYNGRLRHDRALQYTAFLLFGAYTGQRSLATISKLTVGQFRHALKSEKPVLHVKPSQDKIRMEHYIPLHPKVIQAVQPLLDGREDDETMFSYNSFSMWVKREKIPLTRLSSHFVLGDLRKFAD